ncbi:hypothetical protein CB1_000949022 [Camelus ferus]|nr:hypothetical protein CB1_000949022 [Camelus ferus]
MQTGAGPRQDFCGPENEQGDEELCKTGHKSTMRRLSARSGAVTSRGGSSLPLVLLDPELDPEPFSGQRYVLEIQKAGRNRVVVPQVISSAGKGPLELGSPHSVGRAAGEVSRGLEENVGPTVHQAGKGGSVHQNKVTDRRTSLCPGTVAGEQLVHEAFTAMLRVGEGNDLGDHVSSRGGRNHDPAPQEEGNQQTFVLESPWELRLGRPHVGPGQPWHFLTLAAARPLRLTSRPLSFKNHAISSVPPPLLFRVLSLLFTEDFNTPLTAFLSILEDFNSHAIKCPSHPALNTLAFLSSTANANGHSELALPLKS